MNSKLVIAVSAVALAVTAAFAVDQKPASAAPAKKAPRVITKAQMEEMVNKRTGGFLIKKGSFAGKIAIVNAQTKLSDADCAKVAAELTEWTRFNVVADKNAKDATLTLTVIDDPKEPTVLVAPDDRWGKVNVAKLVDDLPAQSAKDKFFAERGRKLIIKGVALLCGGVSSSYPGNIVNCANVRGFDSVAESLPVDVISRFTEYLPQVGVTPKELVPYRKACREGWAPEPTNDYQKAIWNKVHELPSKPIVIEPESKTQKK